MTSETKVIVRQNINHKWIWVLLTPDSHVVNRSDSDFATKVACVMDARGKGLYT